VKGHTNTDVTWSIEGDPAGITVDSNGLVTVGPAVPDGTEFDVIATSVADPTKSATVTITVVEARVSISATSAVQYVDLASDTHDLSGLIEDYTGPITWTAPGAPSGISVDSSGVVTTGSTTTPNPALFTGTNFTVKATATGDPTNFANINCQVVLPITAKFFPDNAFRGALETTGITFPAADQYTDNHPGKQGAAKFFTKAQADAVTGIDMGGNAAEPGSIENIDGIEWFTNLAELRCGYNNISEIDVSKNTALLTLWCYNNQLTVLDVHKNTMLTSLFCHFNQLSELDISMNTDLITLYCYNNLLTDALDVTQNTVLTRLDCYNNELTELDLTRNIMLESLFCSNNYLTVLDISSTNIASNSSNLRIVNNGMTSLTVKSGYTYTDATYHLAGNPALVVHN